MTPGSTQEVDASRLTPMLRLGRSPQLPTAGLRPLQILIGVYIALWIFEGALRKWILPGLANPLLVVRDPVLLVIYVMAATRGIFPKGFLMAWIAVLGVLAASVSFVSTDIPLFIQAYGWRADYFHLPLIFVIVNVIDREGVRLIGKWVLIIGLPMSILVTLQFLSPPVGYLNRGAGGSEDGMLESAFGHIRPSGTFSFTNGLAGFTSLFAGFYLYQLLERHAYPRWLGLAAGPALVTMIALSGSRAIIGLVGLIMATVIFICVIKGRYWGPALKLILVGVLAFVALGTFAIFKDGMNVFAYRFGDSSDVKTGFFGRAIESFLSPYDLLQSVPSTGVGLGVGTNAGAVLLTGKRTFLVAEGEWPRVLMESGPIVGTLFIFLRMAIVAALAAASFRSLWREANTLPCLLLAGSCSELLQGQFSQPSGLGFATIAGALCLAACRNPPLPLDEVVVPTAVETPRPLGIALQSITQGPSVKTLPDFTPPPEATPAPVDEPAGPVRRGRSIYAERLHGSSKDGAA